MEAFQLLARGGVQFDKKRFKNDVARFNVRCCSLFLKRINALTEDSKYFH